MTVDSQSVGADLLEFVTATVEHLHAAHVPGWQIPRTFGGHRVDPDVRADLLYTLTHLAAGGVTTVVGDPIDDVITRLLTGVNGRDTHTFFSYRIAETLLRVGPFAGNPLLERCTDTQRDQVAQATDSRDWIELLDTDILPRNYAAVLSRCEYARQQLGLSEDPAVLDRLVERLGELLDQNPRRFLDDSNDASGRYDIYTADIWLFCEPLAGRLGPRWEDGARAALALVDTVAGPDGAAIPWGRSTGVLSSALTVELGALAQMPALHSDRTAAWLRRAVDAARVTEKRFDPDGVVDAHRHRNQDEYRGPFRRLQLTLDVLGKLAWAGTALRAAPPLEATSAPDTYRTTDELVEFDAGRHPAVWVHAGPAQHVVVPFVGANRSHYLPAPQAPGTFEVPVDNEQVAWAPLVLDRGRRATTAELPDELTHQPHGVRAHWNRLEVMGRGLDGAKPEPLAATCTTTYSVERRTLVADHTLTFERAPDAVALVVPETARAPLAVILTSDTPATAGRVVVEGIAEWSSPYSGIVAVHQLDATPATHVHLRAEVTPKLRVASTAHGHWYDRLLYTPMQDRVVSMAAPLGVLADVSTDLDDVELLHLHWPEWFGFDDPAVHAELVATLADRGIPVVWTAHNLTPHDRNPEVYDPIYQQWAEAADAVIHHSEWGRDRMLARYRFRPECRHEVIVHGHFGDLWPLATTLSRTEAETRLGLSPASLRIGLVGAPRVDKRVVEFLQGVTQSSRTDIQVVCWSLRIDESAPADDRIAVAEHYRGVNDAVYATRLAACDLLAFPFDPDGDMLATGTIADAIGTGTPALISDWPFLTEMLGDAGIPCGHTAREVAAALDALTPESVARAQGAMAALKPQFAWAPLAIRTADLFDRTVLHEP